MDRRRFLAVSCAVLSVGVAGCANGPDTATTGEQTPDSTVTSPTEKTQSSSFDAAEDIAIVVSNGRSSAVTVTLTVTREGEQVFDRTLEVESDGRRTLDPGIDELGEYELTVSLADGTERVRPFDVEAYDRRMRSNLIVEIGDDITVLMEE